MTTMTNYELLYKLAANDPSYKKELAGPWRLQDWLVATDSRALVMVKESLPATVDWMTASKEVERKLNNVMKLPDAPAVWEGNVTALKGFCGEAIWSEPCPACQGISKDNSYVSCSFCESDGVSSPDPRPGYLCGVPLDRNRLACILPALEEGNVKVILSKKLSEVQDMVYLVQPLVRLVLMGMKPTKEGDYGHDEKLSWETAPKFPETTPRTESGKASGERKIGSPQC